MRQHLADYYGMISHEDEWIGRVLAQAPADTIVVYTADHGLALGQHGLMGKQSLYDHSIRVPLIARWPGQVPRGKISDQVGITMDLTATILAAAGATVAPEARPDGVSLLPQLLGKAPAVERTLFFRNAVGGRR